MLRWLRTRERPASGGGAAEGEAALEADRLRDAGRFGEAAQAYRRALDLAPGRVDLRVQLGNMLKDSGSYAEAIGAYEEAALSRPNDADIQLQRGRALKLAGQEDAAVAAFRVALALDPNLDGAVDELGRLAELARDETQLRSSIGVKGPVQVSGWAFDPRRPNRPVALKVEIDGVFYLRLRADLPRGDLRRIAPNIVGGGFSFMLPPGNKSVRVRVLAGDQELRGSPFETRLHETRTLLEPRYAEPLQRGEGPVQRADPAADVVVIVPVYGAPIETQACLESVLTFTGAPARLLVIDDASRDPAVAPMLSSYAGRPGVTVLHNMENIGYTRTVNRAIALSAPADVVLLNSDTVVGPCWLDFMRGAAASVPDVASVTAVSNNAGAFTVPDPDQPTPLPEGWRLEDLQRFVAQTSGRLWPEVVTGNGFCIYMRRAAIEAIGAFDEGAFPRGYGEENDWCMRALARGWRHLVDDRALVHHERSASFGPQKKELMEKGRAALDTRHPHYAGLVADFHVSPRFAESRRRLRAAFAAAPARPRPRMLYVVSSETGGTPLTNRDLMRAVRSQREPFLLTCDSRVMTLSRPNFEADGADEIIARRELTEPIVLARHVSRDYDAQLATWLADYAIEGVHVRHLALQSLDLPAVARAMGLPVLMSFHDFYAVCPTVKLIDETTTWCGGSCTSTPGDCSPDLWRLAAPPPLKHRFVHVWRERFERALAACDAFVTTSASAKATLVGAMPSLAVRRFEVIPHGRDFDRFEPPRHAAPAPVLDILVPGNLSPAKGRDVIAKLATLDQGRRLRFHLLGEVHPPLEAPGVVVHGVYKRDEFAARATRIGAQIGGVFSLWAETYCHTLTELWAIGLPVVAFDFGAVAERLRATGAGWLLPHDDIDVLHQSLLAIADDVADRGAKAGRVASWQAGEGARNGISTMAARYLALYAELEETRRAFAPAREPIT